MAPLSQRRINKGSGKGYSKQVGLMNYKLFKITSISYCWCGTGSRLRGRDIEIRVLISSSNQCDASLDDMS